MDLKSAYEQLPLSPADYNKAGVSLWSSRDCDVACFECRVLPFGAAASAHNFLRASAFLEAAGCSLGILWAMLSHRLHVGSTTLACARSMMTPLDLSTSRSLCRLTIGLRFLDLGRGGDGRVSISSKPSRVSELDDVPDQLMTRRAVVPMAMPSVLGKLEYADSHVWGRAGKLAFADLRELGHAGRSEVPLDDLQVQTLRFLEDRLCSGRPKTLISDDVQRPALIFTDGAWEYDGGVPIATVGGVCLVPDGHCEIFGASVPGPVMQRCGDRMVRFTSLGLVVLYACVVAFLHWKPYCAFKASVMFVDN